MTEAAAMHPSAQSQPDNNLNDPWFTKPHVLCPMLDKLRQQLLVDQGRLSEVESEAAQAIRREKIVRIRISRLIDLIAALEVFLREDDDPGDEQPW